MSETQLLRDTLIALSKDKGVMVWRCNVGSGVTWGGNPISWGVKGMPDIMGVVWPTGRALGVETKVLKGKQREQQERFEAAFMARGGVYVLARSVEDALEAVQRIRESGRAA